LSFQAFQLFPSAVTKKTETAIDRHLSKIELCGHREEASYAQTISALYANDIEVDTMHNFNAVNGCLKMLRFESWIGWLFNFALGSVLFAIPAINRFVSFSFSFALATAGIFVLNQYFDRENDKLNKSKRDLPISSGEISPKAALNVFYFSTFLSICLVILTDIALLPLFLSYLGLGVCYSAPPFYLKNRPILDIVVAGLGSGVLPFVIGVQVSNQFSFDFSLPWVNSFYRDILLSIMPLSIFQAAGHIFQAVGDYEADLRGDIRTFAVKYGKRTSVRLGELFLIVSALLPITFWFLIPSLPGFLHWYMGIFIFCVPVFYYLMNSLKDPSRESIDTLRCVSRKVSPPILSIILIYVLILRTSLP
jgi:4-hydroxybenzoate polyprenyltransferase